MRATPVLGVAFGLVLLSACGRPVSEAGEGARVVIPEQSAPLARERLGGELEARPNQPRLAALLSRRPEKVTYNAPPKAPLATYSRYDGRGPGDAVVPRGTPVSREATLARKLPGQGDVPKRDVVDLGLSSSRPGSERSRPAEPRVAESLGAEPRVAELRRAPAPIPRPVPQTPEPPRRPATTASVTPPLAAISRPATPALPPRPTVAGLASPSLGAPRALIDATPTALPAPPTIEGAIPIGTLPASLGLANPKAAEAAIPVSDTLEQSAAGDSGTLGWTQASALIRAGEVQSADDIGQFEVLLTMCSGVGIITIQPTPTALADLDKPKVICGKAVSLTSQ